MSRRAAPLPGISILIPCRSWRDALPGARAICRRAARAALADAAVTAGEITILLADDAFLRDLNRRFRAIDRPTNVLSFPAAGEPAAKGAAGLLPGPSGDIALAFGTVAAEAGNEGKSLADHVSHLVVHGVLHLLGRDHQAEAEAIDMETDERRILAGLGIADPYDPPEMPEKSAAVPEHAR